MKLKSQALVFLFLLALMACRDTKKEEKEAQAVIEEIEAVESEINENSAEIEADTKELEEALKELDSI